MPSLLWPISCNENHSSNGLGEVICACCYCDRACLAVTKCSNRRGDGIDPLILWYLCENMAPFTSLHKKRLSTESSPLDPPSTHNSVPLGTRALTYSDVHVLRVKERPGGAVSCETSSTKSYCYGFIRWLTWSIVGKVGLMFWEQLRWSSIAMGALTASDYCNRDTQ
jgi:hypothetical protein